MKHLKLFNESLNRNELKEFCEMYLSYLLDRPHFNMDVLTSTKDISTIIINDNPDGNTFSGDKVFNWSDVSDEFIPFLKMLEKNYNIESIYLFIYGKSFKETGLFRHSVKSVGKLSGDTKLKSIEISVSNKNSSFLQKAKSFFKI